MTRRLCGALLLLCLSGGCSSLLPRSHEVTVSPWASYDEAQATFDLIEPGWTTAYELKALSLDPETNPNIAILNYSDVLRRFLVSPSVTLADLDAGVRECISAKIDCRGFEVTQQQVRKHRNGNFWLDFLGFRKETHTAGWRFTGLVLLREDVVVYKLSGGQPSIHQQEKTSTPLGPVQAVGDKLFGTLFPN
ncbi:MAG: hypothetical protein ACT4P3_00085 [Betaproteobacteria bacterium]